MRSTKELWLDQVIAKWNVENGYDETWLEEQHLHPSEGFPGSRLENPCSYPDYPSSDESADPRLAELLDWQCETGKRLPMPIEMILWFETCGYVVDLLTGEATPLEPLQATIDEAADTDEYEDWMDDVAWMRTGC